MHTNPPPPLLGAWEDEAKITRAQETRAKGAICWHLFVEEKSLLFNKFESLKPWHARQSGT